MVCGGWGRPLSPHSPEQVGSPPSKMCRLGASCQQQMKASSPRFLVLLPSCKQVGDFKGKTAALHLKGSHPLGGPRSSRSLPRGAFGLWGGSAPDSGPGQRLAAVTPCLVQLDEARIN